MARGRSGGPPDLFGSRSRSFAPIFTKIMPLFQTHLFSPRRSSPHNGFTPCWRTNRSEKTNPTHRILRFSGPHTPIPCPSCTQCARKSPCSTPGTNVVSLDFAYMGIGPALPDPPVVLRRENNPPVFKFSPDVALRGDAGPSFRGHHCPSPAGAPLPGQGPRVPPHGSTGL